MDRREHMTTIGAALYDAARNNYFETKAAFHWSGWRSIRLGPLNAEIDWHDGIFGTLTTSKGLWSSYRHDGKRHLDFHPNSKDTP